MKRNHSNRPVFQARNPLAVLLFVFLIIMLFTGACSPQSKPSDSEQPFPDKNARMYQMYFDSSGDPAQNELQIRRFIGHLHMAEIEGIFGDIKSLPLDENCNYVGGPVLDDGRLWYLTLTPDLVGANLVSVGLDGTKSSAFDLDGDRVVDLLDIGLIDNRRISIFTEELGMDVFKEWLEGRDAFCNNDIVQQLDLPNLGCDSGDPSGGEGSSGGEGFGPGSGIADPLDLICSEYDTSPMAGLMSKNPNRSNYFVDHYPSNVDWGNGILTTTDTYYRYDSETGAFLGATKVITDINMNTEPPEVIQMSIEEVDSEGNGTRSTMTVNPDGSRNFQEVKIKVDPDKFHPNDDRSDDDSTYRDGNLSEPPAPLPPPIDTSSDPGPEGDDSNIADFCARRANHESGVEQAVKHDPSAISISCGDLVGAPTPNCKILEWAKPEDWRSILEPPSDGGCDVFDDPDKQCEAGGVGDRIRKFLGSTAELWSLDTPDTTLCSPLACDPANAAQLRSYTSGEVNIACPAVANASTATSTTNLRCDLFKDVNFGLVTLDWQPGGPLTFYSKMPGGVPGLETPIVGDDEPVKYSAHWGDYSTDNCKFLPGYPERLYCTMQLPSEYRHSIRQFDLYINGCELPIYSNPRAEVPGYAGGASPSSGDGGSAGGGCNLSVAACSAKGQSFDENNCVCVDIQ